MTKQKRSVTVDPKVWAATQEEAKRLRVSSSWVVETALRRDLKMPLAVERLVKPRETKRARTTA